MKSLDGRKMLLRGLNASYAAGLVDGEGHIGLMRCGTDNVHPVVQVSMCGREPLQFLQTEWGGSLKNYGPRLPSYRTDYWRWILGGWEGLRRFLTDIRPHLRLKCAQAWIVLEFMSQRKASQGVRLTPEEKAVREGYRLALKEVRRLEIS